MLEKKPKKKNRNLKKNHKSEMIKMRKEILEYNFLLDKYAKEYDYLQNFITDIKDAIEPTEEDQNEFEKASKRAEEVLEIMNNMNEVMHAKKKYEKLLNNFKENFPLIKIF